VKQHRPIIVSIDDVNYCYTKPHPSLSGRKREEEKKKYQEEEEEERVSTTQFCFCTAHPSLRNSSTNQ
jgi:hypothetical protein